MDKAVPRGCRPGEKTRGGEPVYEAIVFVGHDEPSNQHIHAFGFSRLVEAAFRRRPLVTRRRVATIVRSYSGQVAVASSTQHSHTVGKATLGSGLSILKKAKKIPFARVTLTKQQSLGF